MARHPSPLNVVILFAAHQGPQTAMNTMYPVPVGKWLLLACDSRTRGSGAKKKR